MIIIKLGGSVITDKSKRHHFKQQVVDRLSREIKKANKEIILVHGAGSFGHITAKEYKLNQGYKNQNQLHGFALTHATVQQLNSLILTSLHNNKIHAVSLAPHALLTLEDHKPLTMDYKIFNQYLQKGFTPVTFGDVVLDKKLGFSICSGDLLIQMLAAYFKPDNVIFVLDEDGLFTSNPKIDPQALFIKRATVQELMHLTTIDDDHADVTKKMKRKTKLNTVT
jgi:isopentenyl phosphate kinase